MADRTQHAAASLHRRAELIDAELAFMEVDAKQLNVAGVRVAYADIQRIEARLQRVLNIVGHVDALQAFTVNGEG